MNGWLVYLVLKLSMVSSTLCFFGGLGIVFGIVGWIVWLTTDLRHPQWTCDFANGDKGEPSEKWKN